MDIHFNMSTLKSYYSIFLFKHYRSWLFNGGITLYPLRMAVKSHPLAPAKLTRIDLLGNRASWRKGTPLRLIGPVLRRPNGAGDGGRPPAALESSLKAKLLARRKKLGGRGGSGKTLNGRTTVTKRRRSATESELRESRWICGNLLPWRSGDVLSVVDAAFGCISFDFLRGVSLPTPRFNYKWSNLHFDLDLSFKLISCLLHSMTLNFITRIIISISVWNLFALLYIRI